MAQYKTIYCIVINDLSYDQRMQRICNSLAEVGYKVVLVGRKMPASISLKDQLFKQKRLSVWFQKGKIFYIEYNIRLFFYLLFKKIDIICAIDLDTIIPSFWISKLKKIKRVYDAHELFTEMKEVVTRPKIHRFWLWVERSFVPKFQHGYTVNQFIANELERRYGVKYSVIRNLPKSASITEKNQELKFQHSTFDIQHSTFFLYQGAVNEGRSFETLIPAMQNVSALLVIVGDGNFMHEVKRLIEENKVQNKIICLGAVPPDILRQITPKAYYGLTLFEKTGLNQYYSLANRFFDYIQSGVPQLCVDYPEYEAINQQYEVAFLIKDLSPQSLSTALNKLLEDDVLHRRLTLNCVAAAKDLCWENESEKLIRFYKNI